MRVLLAWSLKEQSYLVGCRQRKAAGVCFGVVLPDRIQQTTFVMNELLNPQATKKEFIAKARAGG